MTDRPQKIIVVRLSALGDVVMMIPVMRTLRRALPDAEISWLISRPAYDIVAGLEGIEFIVIEKPHSLTDYLKLRQRFSGRRFDVCLAMQASLRVNLIYPFISAARKIGYDTHRARDAQGIFINERIDFRPQHLVDSFFAFIEAIGIHERQMDWHIPVSSDDKQWAEQYVKPGVPLLIVNPAASKSERNWPTERYIEVLQRLLQEQTIQVILTGGPAAQDREICAQIQQGLTATTLNLQGRTTPKQLAALLQRADCLLAPDTGPVHIASAVGTPVIGLYAVAPPELSAPYNDVAGVINAYPLACEQLLGKSSQDVEWGTRVHHEDAMRCITSDEVLSHLQRVFT